MKQEGNKAIIQLAHAGRFSNTAMLREVYGPSPMTLHSPIKHDVLEMSVEKFITSYNNMPMQHLEQFKLDLMALKSPLHNVYSFKLSSTFSNQRHDQYGVDSLENRARFGLEVMQAVQKSSMKRRLVISYSVTERHLKRQEVVI